MAKLSIPRTKSEKGRMWATVTLLICGAYSLWANVRSGQFAMENLVTSAMPPVVAFLSSHLIGYFSPRRIATKLLIWGIGGVIMVFAMIGSGTHIVEYVVRNGQPFQIALIYVFITDAPMLLAGAILLQKVPTTAAPAKRTIETTVANQSKTASVPKATQPAKKATPAKRTTPSKSSQSVQNALKVEFQADPLESEMTNV